MRKELLLFLAAVATFVPGGHAQDFDAFEVEPVPDPFTLSSRYPDREEVDVCRAIRDHIDEGTPRFTSELVTNGNSDIRFASGARVMSSRMQTRLNRLATLYGTFRVQKAWTQFPDPEVEDDRSLHYEGRTARIRIADRFISTSEVSEFLTLAVQTGFDWVSYDTSTYVRLSVIPDGCEGNIDLCWMLDQSGSVGRSNHDTAKQFISNVVSFFTIGPARTRVGFVAYSTNSHTEFDLDDFTSLTSLQEAIDNVNYRGGWTSTALALNDSRDVLDPSLDNGARAVSEGIPKLAVLLTDGKSNQYPLDYAAPGLRNSGVQVYTVGIGNIDIDELRLIASDPDSEHVFLLNSFNDALGFVNFLSVTACETPAIINACEDTVTDVSGGFIRYFQVECSLFSDEIMVQVTDTMGTSFLYCSTTESNPGPLTDNTQKDETMGVSARQCAVDLSGSSRRVIHIGVQGQEDQNQFTLAVWDSEFFTTTVESINAVEGPSFQFDVSSRLSSAASSLTLEYSIEQGNEDGTFSIDSQTGILSLAKDLDFDTIQSFQLTINARRQDSSCCHRAQITLNIQVFRNRIDFPDPNTATVSELAAVDSEVITFQASGGAGVLEYSITGGNMGNAFAIHPTSGVITVNDVLDFESRDTYTLTITVQSAVIGVSDSADQEIMVIDENEAPFFMTPCAVASTCTVTVPESTGASFSIGLQLTADDLDRNTLPNGMIEYRISDSTFTVNQIGMLFTKPGVQLDREDTDSYSITVIAEDDGSPSLSVSTVVQITVSDINDNTPVFIQGPTVVDVDENSQSGSDIAQYIATDEDEGSNAVIDYALSSDVQIIPFELDPVSGVLSVNGPIDYEEMQQYNVTITASNPDGTSVSITTTINVNDLNDNAPVFDPETHALMVVEHSNTSFLVLTVEASDRDSGLNGDIRYSITNGNADSAFALDSVSGALTVDSDIDRETTNSFTLTVLAQDLGNPRQSGFATVIIDIADINDNTPQFNPDSYTIVLREDTPIGFNILSVFAFDLDEPGNPNSEIIFAIESGDPTGTFSLHNSTGLLQLAMTLDFETQPNYELAISATDRGAPQLSDTATVTIQVVNVNEFPPVLNGSQTVNISELAPVPQDIVSFTAQDLDAGASVTYGIDSGNDEGTFKINGGTGLVTLIQSLDYETTEFYEFEITASDGQATDTARLTVYVIDENDFGPEFTGETQFEIKEEMRAGTLVGRVSATDGDGSPVNSRITYLLQGSVIQDYISLNASSGEITTTQRLDREQLTQIFPPPASMRSVDVIARDSGSPSLQARTTITITLSDINDNAPLFVADTYENSFRENLPSGMLVFQPSATDEDLGSNAIVLYSLTVAGVANPPFEIDASSGVVRTNESLDREEQEVYAFSITATDQGDMPMSSTVLGSFTVLDENDNDPTFTMPVYEITVSESVQIGQLDLEVQATDVDKGLNGQVQYVLVGQEDLGVGLENDFREGTLFEIGIDSGVINHITPLDYEIQAFLNLTIMAYDLGVPRRSSFAEIHITVTNFDEAPPSFPEINCNQEIPEDIGVGNVVRHCVAHDPDNTTAEGQVAIFYSLTLAFDPSVAEYFEVNQTTGEIRTIRELDYDEGRTRFELSILARDAAGRFALIQPAVITVTDVNDNDPQFRNAPYEYALTNSRLRAYNRLITSVDATDLDSLQTGNGKLAYNIESITRSETNLETVLKIVATDGGSPQRSASTNLTVTFETPCILQRYNIDSSNGDITVDALCSIEVSPLEANVTLGTPHRIFCTVLRNGPTTYQWIHNGSIITGSLSLSQSQQQATREILSIEFDDSGEHSCKVTTATGSLQANPVSTVHIQVPPTVTVPPEDTAGKEGETVHFKCVAVGIPEPSIVWTFNQVVVGMGKTLEIEAVSGSDEGTYMCGANNGNGEPATASAKLIIYGPSNEVEVILGGISSPSDDATCNHFNLQTFLDIITQQTDQTTMSTGVTGEALCEQSACSPNPCQNRGSCEISDNIVGGYECLCRAGFMGTDCSDDVRECLEGPCGFGATCVDVPGSYLCTCPDGRTGGRCQFDDVCNEADRCLSGKVCVESLSSLEGYVCIDEITNPREFLVIEVSTFAGGQRLEELLLAFAETQAQQNSADSNNKRKRQTVSDPLILCEPRVQQLNNTHSAVVWLCPITVDPPSDPDQLAELCSFILEVPDYTSCQPPNGDIFEQPTAPTLPESTVTVTLIQVDPETDEPLTAGDVLDNLDDSDAIGIVAAQLEADVNVTVSCENGQPDGRGRCVCDRGWTGLRCDERQEERDDSSSSDNTGAVVGAVVGTVIAAIAVAVIVVVVIVVVSFVVMSQHSHKRKQEEKRHYAQELAVFENADSRANETTLPASNSPIPLQPGISTELLVEDNDYDELPPSLPSKPVSQPAQSAESDYENIKVWRNEGTQEN